MTNLPPSSAKVSLFWYSLRHRLHARFYILLVALGSAVLGLMSPFFQKVFVDRLLGSPIITHGWSGMEWIETVGPLFLIFLAFVCTMGAQALGLYANFIGIGEGAILQRDFSERLYRKMLAIRSDSMGSTTVGEVVSIYATDVQGSTAVVDQALPMGASIIFPLIFAPLAIRWMTGIPLTVTLTVMGVMVCLNIILATRQSRFFYRFKLLAAERTGIVNEWVQNIRLLRILGWTEYFEAKIFTKRQEETQNRVAMVTNGQLMNSFGSSITYVINLTGVAALIFLRAQSVTAGELFALLWIFGVFLTRPFRQIPWIFTYLLDSLTSIRRLERFLNRPSEPVDMSAVSAKLNSAQQPREVSNQEKAEALGLEVKGLTLELNGQKQLDDVSFSVLPGEFIAVVGEVGSGKSLLILSLMAETAATFEKFVVGQRDALKMDLNTRRRQFAFVPQEGFVMSATLRENVAFRYDAPESADEDIKHSLALAQFRVENEQVSEGLNAEIGERGVNLSGGQRQRVSLGRAHFIDRPILLLDDCLSAVDVDTENQLIRDLISGAWKNKTRLLVTHRLSVLAKVDRIFFMERGQIVETGTLDELLERSERMRQYVASVRRGETGSGSDSNPNKAEPTQQTVQEAESSSFIGLSGKESDVETESVS